MDKGILSDREKAMEGSYFRQQDEALLAKLRQKAKLDEIAVALAEKLQVDNPDLLERVRELGVTVDTAPALFLAPLVQVAWAEGSVTARERECVLRLARERGVEANSPALAQLSAWLDERPQDTLFATAVEVLKYGFKVLDPFERDARIKTLTDACHEVAAASGSELARLLGLGDGVSNEESQILDQIIVKLRRHEGD